MALFSTQTQFDSSTVSLLLSGVPIKGFGDNKISLSRSNDLTEMIEGLDGDQIFSTSNKTSGELSFDLLYGTDYDNFLDELTGFKKLFVISFFDTESLKALTTFGRVKSQPDITINTAPDSRTWTLVLSDVTMLSTTGSSLLFAGVTPYLPAGLV